MNAQTIEKLRKFLQTRLALRGSGTELQDGDSIFLSGRLDSLEMTHLVLYLEQECGLDFSAVPFDIELIDSIESIVAFSKLGAQG